jgi:carboxymethylenebutenolidase
VRQDIIELYDDYTHSRLERRVFMARLAELAGGTAAAAALLPLLGANYAHAAIVPEDDPRIVTQWVHPPAAAGELRGYLAVPSSAVSPPFPDMEGKRPGVLVIHENRGLNPHIQDVTRHLAAEGFVALAPDFLSILGGTPVDEDRARELIGQLETNQVVTDAEYALEWLANRDDTTGEVGIVGFCWGGGIVGRVAAAAPELDAAVVFYGSPPPLDQVPNIEAALLLHYAGLDQRINAQVPAFEEALKEANVGYQLYIYEGVNHAFHNDTAEARYDKEAAELAWKRTIDFLKEQLKPEAG